MNKVTDINGITGEQIVRDMNADELAQLEIDITSEKIRAKAKAAKKTARQAVLDKLGLTQDEAQALLG